MKKLSISCFDNSPGLKLYKEWFKLTHIKNEVNKININIISWFSSSAWYGFPKWEIKIRKVTIIIAVRWNFMDKNFWLLMYIIPANGPIIMIWLNSKLNGVPRVKIPTMVKKIYQKIPHIPPDKIEKNKPYFQNILKCFLFWIFHKK